MTGDNGLLTKSGNAKNTTENSKIIEQDKLDISEKILENNGEIIKEEQLTEILKKYFDESDVDGITDFKSVDYELTPLSTGKKIKLADILTGIDVKEATFDAKYISEYVKDFYGKTVNYKSKAQENNTPLNTSVLGNNGTWKIFYGDDNNIYLKVDSNIKIPNHIDGIKFPNNNIIRAGGYVAKFCEYNNGATGGILDRYTTGVLDGDSNILKHVNNDASILKKLNKTYYYKEDGTENFSANANLNFRAIASMLDTSAWEIFMDLDSNGNSTYADYAIGGPTVEMFCDSYTQAHKDNDNDSTNDVWINYKVVSGGYKVQSNVDTGFADNTVSNSIPTGNSNIDNLYRPDKSIAYWFASPIAAYEGSIRIMLVNCNKGNVESAFAWGPYYGFCPVVCLKSDVQLKRVKNETFDFDLKK